VGFGRGLLFFFVCLMGMLILRRLGWTLSRAIFYSAPWVVSILLLITWGTGVAFGFRHLVLWLHVGWLLKIFGYGTAAYVSIPNFGLIAESTIPDHAQPRHLTISNLSLVVFIVLSIVFAFTIK
jgi:hypothetical protein